MKNINATNKRLIETVVAHLENLEHVARYDVNETNLIVTSGSLRYLLVDNYLALAWKYSKIGGPITLKTWCITSILSKNITAFCGGGEILPGVPISIAFDAELAELQLNLIDFRKRTRIQIGEIKISTTDLIKYIANTQGGTHFDPEGRSPKSKKEPFETLRKLESREIGHLPVSLVNNRNLLHHEILSIIQSILNSQDVRKLMAWTETK